MSMESSLEKKFYCELMGELSQAQLDQQKSLDAWEEARKRTVLLAKAADAAYQKYQRTLNPVKVDNTVNHHGKQKAALDRATKALKSIVTTGLTSDKQVVLVNTAIIALQEIEEILK